MLQLQGVSKKGNFSNFRLISVLQLGFYFLDAISFPSSYRSGDGWVSQRLIVSDVTLSHLKLCKLVNWEVPLCVDLMCAL